jgi:uncharacterized protein
MIHSDIQKQLPSVIQLFKQYNIRQAFLFGSAVTDRFNEKSDVDFLVNFKDDISPLEKGEALLDLQIALEDTLHRNIDLLTENSLKNPYFIDELNEKKVKIYE